MNNNVQDYESCFSLQFQKAGQDYLLVMLEGRFHDYTTEPVSEERGIL